MKLRQIILLLIAVATAGCHLIDDDLSVCGTNANINYELRLVTEVQMQIDERISSETDKPIADALKAWSKPFFSGTAHDLDMSFFSLDGDGELLEHKSDTIDASQKSYTLYIPRKDYQHLAVVNITENKNVSLMGGQYANSMRITQHDYDTLDSHNTAFYTARLPMYMADKDSDLTFNVHLYMVSCGVALVLTADGSTIPTVRNVVLNGTATSFNINDSTFSYTGSRPVRFDQLINRCYATIAMPSPDAPKAESAKRKVESQLAEDNALWKVRFYASMPDGKITETVLSIPYALKAGTLEIIKAQLQDDGSLLVVENMEVGATINLDWKEGSEQELTTG